MSQERKNVQDTIQMIKDTTELFYQRKTQEAYVKMQDTVTSIMGSIEVLHQYKIEHEEFSLDEQRIVTALTEAMNAMEEGDTILLADILEYDFIEYLQELIEEM